MKLGDAISTVAIPIARALHMPCIDPTTNQLRPESTCNQVRIDLNEGRYWDAFNDRFFRRNSQQPKETNQMEPTDELVPFHIVVVLNAKDVVDALARYKTEGTVKSINPIPPQQRPPTGAQHPATPK